MTATLRFRRNQVVFSKDTLEAIGMPEWVHLLYAEDMFAIQACERDHDAVSVYHQDRYYVTGAPLLELLAGIAGVSTDSDSMRYEGCLVEEEQAVVFGLRHGENVSREYVKGRIKVLEGGIIS